MAATQGDASAPRGELRTAARPHSALGGGCRIMKTTRACKCLAIGAFGLILAGLTGCQTTVAGMTLPSGYYLQHKPQYFRPDPDFPLEKELATMQGQNNLIDGGGKAIEAPGAQPK